MSVRLVMISKMGFTGSEEGKRTWGIKQGQDGGLRGGGGLLERGCQRIWLAGNIPGSERWSWMTAANGH